MKNLLKIQMQLSFWEDCLENQECSEIKFLKSMPKFFKSKELILIKQPKRHVKVSLLPTQYFVFNTDLYKLYGIVKKCSQHSQRKFYSINQARLQQIHRPCNSNTIQTAKLLGCKANQIKNIFVWGNHSRKQFWDPSRIEVEGLSNEFISEKLKGLDIISL